MVYNDYGKQLHAFIALPQHFQCLKNLKQDCINIGLYPVFLNTA